MVRVLVLGATGYVGLATCQALRRNSHVVYGLARSEEKANELAKHEIIPVLGTAEDGAYLCIVESANIDVIIDAAGANEGSWKILEDVKRVGAERLGRRGGKSPRLGFIYVSGTWVHGSTQTTRLNDLNPVCDDNDPGCPNSPPSLVAWRPELEQGILAAKDALDTMIVRPSLIYGRGCAIWSLYFSQLQRAANAMVPSVEIQCNPDTISSLVHVDEVASALVSAMEQLSRVASSAVYPVFDITTSREPLRVILETAARVIGFHGNVKFIEPVDGFPLAMCTSARLESTRARDLLGWESKRMFGMLEEIEIMVGGWRATSGAVVGEVK